MTTSQQIKVRNCQIQNKNHPEWGTFGVSDEEKYTTEEGYKIHNFIVGLGAGRARNVSADEIDSDWELVK